MEGTKQLLIVCLSVILAVFVICYTSYKNKQLNCQNISRYNNTLQHDINLETVCK